MTPNLNPARLARFTARVTALPPRPLPRTAIPVPGEYHLDYVARLADANHLKFPELTAALDDTAAITLHGPRGWKQHEQERLAAAAGQPLARIARLYWPDPRELPGVLVSRCGALAQPGQPPLQTPPGRVVSEFRGQAHHLHVVLPGQPARQQLPVISNKFSQLIQVFVPGQPLSQLMQGGVAPAGSSLAEFVEVVTVSQPAGQPQPGHIIPAVGQRTDHLDGLLGSGPLSQPAGQLPPGVLVSGAGALAQLPGLVIFGQLVGPPPPLRVFHGAAQRTGSLPPPCQSEREPAPAATVPVSPPT